MRFKDAGWASRAEYERERQTDDYVRWQAVAAQQKDRGRGDLAGPNSDFGEFYARAKNEGWSHDAGGAFADLLVYVGLRDADDEWDVGDTP